MRKFKVGDKVRLKTMTRREFDKCDTNAGMLTCMFSFVGQVHIVRDIGSPNYLLEAPDGGKYLYSPNWIEPAVKFKGNK